MNVWFQMCPSIPPSEMSVSAKKNTVFLTRSHLYMLYFNTPDDPLWLEISKSERLKGSIPRLVLLNPLSQTFLTQASPTQI